MDNYEQYVEKALNEKWLYTRRVARLWNRTIPQLQAMLDEMEIQYPPANLFTDKDFYRGELIKLVAKNQQG